MKMFLFQKKQAAPVGASVLSLWFHKDPQESTRTGLVSMRMTPTGSSISENLVPTCWNFGEWIRRCVTGDRVLKDDTFNS